MPSFDPIGFPVLRCPLTPLLDPDVDASGYIEPNELPALSDKEIGAFVRHSTVYGDEPALWGTVAKVPVSTTAELLASLPDGRLAGVLVQAGFDDGSGFQRAELAQALYQQVGAMRFAKVLALTYQKLPEHVDPLASTWSQSLLPQQRDELVKMAATASRHLANVFAAPPMDDRFKQDIGSTFLDLVAKYQAVFITDNHDKKDEVLFHDLMEQAHARGAVHLGIELEKGFAGYLQEFAATENYSVPIATLDESRGRTLFALAKKAIDAGLTIKYLDMPEVDIQKQLAKEGLLPSYFKFRAGMQSGHPSIEDLPAGMRFLQIRDEYMAQQIEQSAEDGKGVFWVGGMHAVKDTQPVKSARAIVEAHGISAATLKLEEAVGNNTRCSPLAVFNQAYQTYFCAHPAGMSFAYSASELGELAFRDNTGDLVHGEAPLLRYADAATYVGFLSPGDARPL